MVCVACVSESVKNKKIKRKKKVSSPKQSWWWWWWWWLERKRERERVTFRPENEKWKTEKVGEREREWEAINVLHSEDENIKIQQL